MASSGSLKTVAPNERYNAGTEGSDNKFIGHIGAPTHFVHDLKLHIQGIDWRSYNDIVGQPIFYSGFTDEIKKAVMGNVLLQHKVRELAVSRVRKEQAQGIYGSSGERARRKEHDREEQIVKDLTERAQALLDGLICKMESKVFIRSAYYAVTTLLTRTYHQGIHVSTEEVAGLKAVAEQAASKRQSIIFLPSHRSHVDYVALQLVCYRLGLALPTVVAGDNLNFPVLGSFLQHAGAMWIRRSFGDDSMYVTLVQAYLDTLLTKGLNFECFIEGGRSRTGKLLPPKFGILSFLLDSILSGRVEDAYVCPVSTQYDKVIEVDSYISELLGQPKRKENLKDFLSASSVLSLKLGRVDIRFQQPWSLRQFLETQQRRIDGTSLYKQGQINTQMESSTRIRLLRTLGFKVLVEINSVSVIMPTSLIGTVLLTLRGRGVGKRELISRVDWLCDRVRAQGGRVAHFAGQPTSAVVQRGLDVLGPALVGVHEDLIETTYFAIDRFQLSFYRNMTIHLFINQALVSVSLYTCIKASGEAKCQTMSYEDILAHVTFLSQLFRGEFIFPTEGLETNLARTLVGLETDRVIQITRSVNGVDTQDTISHLEVSEAEKSQGRHNFDFYCFLIWPFVDASWLGAVSLLLLVPPAGFGSKQPQVLFRAFHSAAQLLGKTLYAQGDLSYLEAVNKEVLKNTFARFEEDGLITIRKPSDRAQNKDETIELTNEWVPEQGVINSNGRLWKLCEEINRYRIEGKNRRDGDAAVTRLIHLIEETGKRLWENDHPTLGSNARL